MNPLNLLVAVVFAATPPTPAIAMNQDQLSAATGQTLSLESVVSHQTSPAIAHLNVTSLDGVYVDLEDWTKDVTQPVRPGEETQLDWEVQAVNSGHFAIYVVLIPQNGPLIVSPPVHLTVATRQTLNTGGALPVALTIPTLLGLAALAPRIRRGA
jgi:hypothetical protein